jgi:hypothetical protein
MRAFPIFTDRTGRVIGDEINEMQYDDTVYDNEVDPAETPGVHMEETQAETPGVDTAIELGPTPLETIDYDLDFAPTNDIDVDPPMIDEDAPVVNDPVVDGPRRSTRVRVQPKPAYIPSMTGKKYAFATTVLGTKMLEDESYRYNQQVAFSFMQQLSVKAAIKEWGQDAVVAGEKEANQLHWRETFVSRQMSELTTI